MRGEECAWHHCEKFAGDAGWVDIVSDGKTWWMQDREYHYGETFQHGTTIAIVFCPFCGVRLGASNDNPK